MYNIELIFTFFIEFTDILEKNMPDIAPSSESDDGIPQWLLAVLIVIGIIILTIPSIVTLPVIAMFVHLIQSCGKSSKWQFVSLLS